MAQHPPDWDRMNAAELMSALEADVLICGALVAWVESIGPGTIPADQLEGLWMYLAHALRAKRPGLVVRFIKEMHDARGTEREGYPPARAISSRLAELQAASLSPYFLASAIARAFRTLIEHAYPAHLVARWDEIAQARALYSLDFSPHPLEMQRGPVTFGPAPEERMSVTYSPATEEE